MERKFWSKPDRPADSDVAPDLCDISRSGDLGYRPVMGIKENARDPKPKRSELQHGLADGADGSGRVVVVFVWIIRKKPNGGSPSR